MAGNDWTNVGPGDLVRVTEDQTDEHDPHSHHQEAIYRFVVSSVDYFDVAGSSGPRSVHSGTGLDFDEWDFGVSLELLEKALVPWQQGFRIRALLDSASLDDEQLHPDEIRLLGHEVTLEPGSRAGQWVITEHREFLEMQMQNLDEGSEWTFGPPAEVSLKQVRQGRLVAAPMEYFSWMMRQGWKKLEDPPHGYTGTSKYLQASEIDKLTTHLRWDCYFGPENDAAAPS